MVFPTLDFLLFFAVVLVLRQILRGYPASGKAMLVAASYFFYAAWDWRFCFLMLGVSLVAWAGGLLVAGGVRAAKAASIIALLTLLATFKYADFFVLSLQQLMAGTAFARDIQWIGLVLPVGISFYIFQAISYIMDVARGDIRARRNPTDILLYVSFFPQLVAGPIVRASDFLPQIDRFHEPDSNDRALATILILTGLFKKMVVANYLSVLLVDPVFAFPAGQAAPQAIAATLGYGIQIYCDFSGYSDIAIGVALLLGFHFSQNFNQPYRASSLRDFWRRWHISLSTWIRDYLYIPLGGNSGGVLRQVLTLVLTMTLAGLWHGAGWNFLAWGFLHGIGLAAERIGRAAGIVVPFGGVLAVVFVLVLWIPFRSPDLSAALDMFAAFARMAGDAPAVVPPQAIALIAIGFAINWLPLRLIGRTQTVLCHTGPIMQAMILSAGTFLLFALAQDGVAPFIYFQF